MRSRSHSDLPAQLPLFPLPGAVLMPRSRLPLHLFEPRYLQMLEDTIRTEHRMIGMIQPMGDALAGVGTAGRVVAFNESDDGRVMISLKAVSRFRLHEVEEGFAPYLRGRVSWDDFGADLRADGEDDPAFDREAFLSRLRRYMASLEISTDWEAASEADDEMLVNALAMLLPLDPEEKQALLEAPTLPERREILDGLIEYALHAGSAEVKIQ